MKLLILPPALLASAMIACGGGSHASKAVATPPTATPRAIAGTPQTFSPQVATTLHKYELGQADLPDGYSIGLTIDVPNEQASLDTADPQAARKEVQETGRLGGLGQQVQLPAGEASTIGVSIELFPDAKGAQRWATDPPPLPSAMSPTPVKLDQPPGDHASAVHFVDGANAGYVLSFSRGTVVYGIGVSAPKGKESLNTALDLARRLDQKAQRLSS